MIAGELGELAGETALHAMGCSATTSTPTAIVTRSRRIQSRIHDARFPMLKTLDALSFEAQPDLDRDAVLQAFDCRFVAEAANVVFVGGVGDGPAASTTTGCGS